MSIRARIRASRNVEPMSAIALKATDALALLTRTRSGAGLPRSVQLAAVLRPTSPIPKSAHAVGPRSRANPGLRLGEAREDARNVPFGDQHLARFRSFIARDHAAPLEHVDQPARTRVAQTQATLEHRGRGGAHLRDQRDRLLEQR